MLIGFVALSSPWPSPVSWLYFTLTFATLRSLARSQTLQTGRDRVDDNKRPLLLLSLLLSLVVCLARNCAHAAIVGSAVAAAAVAVAIIRLR